MDKNKKTMFNLFPIMEENKALAIELLKGCDGKLVEFDYEEETDYDDRPYILIQDRYGMIQDLAVSKVALTDSNKIEVYIEDWEEWVPIEYALSTTENNVYMALEKVLIEREEA